MCVVVYMYTCFTFLNTCFDANCIEDWFKQAEWMPVYIS